ncbi:MAG: class I SAM-dependent methyltransferase [Terrimicrobiaceae bacterium]|nr:class I SAM-dependent methyltransferase [Terrimicrobiaceae bacterium]
MGRWLDVGAWANLLDSGTDAFRLMSGTGGQRVERFGESVLVSVGRDDELPDLLRDLDDYGVKVQWVPGAIYGRHLVRSPGRSDVPFVIRGTPAAEPVAHEDGLAFTLDFGSGYSPGLFPDQRENRRELRRLRPLRLLNTFAYTGAFSVVAAAVGAETVSVDISKAALDRARRNFELNGLELHPHRFVVEDVPTYLRRLERRGDRFDAIVLDPPTFGRGGGGKTFRIERDWQELVTLAAAALQRPGVILLSCNFASWTASDLREQSAGALPRGTVFRASRRPEDFPPGTGAESVWAVVS